ncbi:response regulator [Pseudoroseomonas globiformis]|uniref:Response regulator n=1 Tax=Teichococcus globiformis TaxID=2307229 RepID=A0ABV7FYK3_9PROT
MSVSRTKLLLVDDEPQIHRFLGAALSAAGYDPIKAETGEEGLRLAATRQPSLILLDLGLPDIDGQVLIPRLRAFSAIPILVVSARGHEDEKVAALDAGADDYVEKPFALAELLARIRAALRRSIAGEPSVEDAVIRVGPLSINIEHRLARIDGDEALRLTPREWSLLVTLARASGRVMTQRQLLTAVWGPAHSDEAQYLRVYVGHLRQKLGRAAGLLKTEPGIGYRFSE